MFPVCDSRYSIWSRMEVESLLFERMIVPLILLYGLHRLLRLLDDGSGYWEPGQGFYLLYGGLFMVYQVGLSFLLAGPPAPLS